jgi:hypothetical protein
MTIVQKNMCGGGQKTKRNSYSGYVYDVITFHYLRMLKDKEKESEIVTKKIVDII